MFIIMVHAIVLDTSNLHNDGDGGDSGEDGDGDDDDDSDDDLWMNLISSPQLI